MAVRRASAEDFAPWFRLLGAVAGEGRWLGREAPVDEADARRRFLEQLDDPSAEVLLAEVDGRLVGSLGIGLHRGVAELGMQVDEAWRGRGIGSGLLSAAIAWAGQSGAHKVALQVWPHNAGAIALYRKFGFAEEGRLRRHYRRRNGELWDAVQMGLVLDEASPGSPYDGAA